MLTCNEWEKFLGRRLWSWKDQHSDQPIFPKLLSLCRMQSNGPCLWILESHLVHSPICQTKSSLLITPNSNAFTNRRTEVNASCKKDFWIEKGEKRSSRLRFSLVSPPVPSVEDEDIHSFP